jgi:hypothetical protein
MDRHFALRVRSDQLVSLVDLALLTPDHCERFAEVDLGVPRIVAQWHEYLAQPLAARSLSVCSCLDPFTSPGLKVRPQS